MKRLIILLQIFLISACSSFPTTPTETLLPTLVYDYRTFPKDSIQPTITAPPSRFFSGTLPNGLELEEYPTTNTNDYTLSDFVYDRHPESGGLYYFPKGGLIDGKLFWTTETHSEIHAFLDGEQITTIKCPPSTFSRSVINAWTYENHWIIEVFCRHGFDIFWDGNSLNASKGYQSSFAFQLLDKKPFYLFERDKQVWLYYEGQEVALDYDKILLYCCENSPPKHYENMITFYAIKENQIYYVAIGLFDN